MPSPCSDHPPTEPACTTCPHSGEASRPPILLADALQRFERDAVHGICPTGRYRMPYSVWGAGPPLILIPGLADDRQSFVLLMAHLAPRFRCIAYDLPAGGADEARLTRYTLADLADDLFHLLDHLQVRQGYLLGVAFGSLIALQAAHDAPDRLRRILLLEGFAHRRLAPAELLLAHLARFWPGTLRQLPLRPALLHHSYHAEFAGQSPEVWRHYLARTGAFPIAAIAARLLWLRHADVRPLLPRIQQPVLLVGDTGQPWADPLLRDLPNARATSLAEPSHHPFLTHPADLALLVTQFLTLQPSP